MSKKRTSNKSNKISPSRTQDWLNQAKRDLELANLALDNGYYEWTCYLCEQSAEKALKGLGNFLRRLPKELRGHSTNDLLRIVPLPLIPKELDDACRKLDEHAVISRYPDSKLSGYPGNTYKATDAKKAKGNAELVLRFVEKLLSKLDKAVKDFESEWASQ